MDSLFLLASLIVLALLGGWALGIAGHVRAGTALRQVAALRAELAALRGEVNGMAGALVAAGFRPPEPRSRHPAPAVPMPVAGPARSRGRPAARAGPHRPRRRPGRAPPRCARSATSRN